MRGSRTAWWMGFVWVGCLAWLTACGGDTSAPAAPSSQGSSAVSGGAVEKAPVFPERDLDVAAAREALTAVEEIQLLDVRTQKEWDEGYIDGAIHIPIADLEGRLEELDSSRPVLVYCAAGVRSAKALKILDEAGFATSAHMQPGFRGWSKAGHLISTP